MKLPESDPVSFFVLKMEGGRGFKKVEGLSRIAIEVFLKLSLALKGQESSL